MFGMGNCVSLQIDKKGLYYILKEQRVWGEVPHATDLYGNLFVHSLSRSLSKFTVEMFAAWVDQLFRIGEVVYGGSKQFHNKGVILTTDAVQEVSVHYMKYIPPNPNAKKKVVSAWWTDHSFPPEGIVYPDASSTTMSTEFFVIQFQTQSLQTSAQSTLRNSPEIVTPSKEPKKRPASSSKNATQEKDHKYDLRPLK